MYTMNLRYFKIVGNTNIYTYLLLQRTTKTFFYNKLLKFYKSTFSYFSRSLNQAKKPHPLAICSPDIP